MSDSVEQETHQQRHSQSSGIALRRKCETSIAPVGPKQISKTVE